MVLQLTGSKGNKIKINWWNSVCPQLRGNLNGRVWFWESNIILYKSATVLGIEQEYSLEIYGKSQNKNKIKTPKGHNGNKNASPPPHKI